MAVAAASGDANPIVSVSGATTDTSASTSTSSSSATNVGGKDKNRVQDKKLGSLTVYMDLDREPEILNRLCDQPASVCICVIEAGSLQPIGPY